MYMYICTYNIDIIHICTIVHNSCLVQFGNKFGCFFGCLILAPHCPEAVHHRPGSQTRRPVAAAWSEHCSIGASGDRFMIRSVGGF